MKICPNCFQCCDSLKFLRLRIGALTVENSLNKDVGYLNQELSSCRKARKIRTPCQGQDLPLMSRLALKGNDLGRSNNKIIMDLACQKQFIFRSRRPDTCSIPGHTI